MNKLVDNTKHVSEYSRNRLKNILIGGKAYKLYQYDGEVNESVSKEVQLYMKKILLTFTDQYHGWNSMNIFEKQWVLRNLKKFMSLSAEQASVKLKLLDNAIHNGNFQIIADENFFLKTQRILEIPIEIITRL